MSKVESACICVWLWLVGSFFYFQLFSVGVEDLKGLVVILYLQILYRLHMHACYIFNNRGHDVLGRSWTLDTIDGGFVLVSTCFLHKYKINHTEWEKKLFSLNILDEKKMTKLQIQFLITFKKAFQHWQTLLWCNIDLTVGDFLQYSAPERADSVLLMSAALAVSH